MPVFRPSLSHLKESPEKMTKAEWELLNFIEHEFTDPTFEVYFHPNLNGDRPTAIAMAPRYGVFIFTICERGPEGRVNEHFANPAFPSKQKTLSDSDRIKEVSDILEDYKAQANQYKHNLQELHVKSWLQEIIADFSVTHKVKLIIYCPNISQKDIQASTSITEDFLILGRNSLGVKSQSARESDMERFHSFYNKYNPLTSNVVGELRQMLNPPYHFVTDGINFNYTSKQRELIYSTQLEQRVKGVFGSGKSMVLVARAVQAYKRAKARGIERPNILIVTYNITLRNYLFEKLYEVPEEFDPAAFIIIGYHQLISSTINNLRAQNEQCDIEYKQLMADKLKEGEKDWVIPNSFPRVTPLDQETDDEDIHVPLKLSTEASNQLSKLLDAVFYENIVLLLNYKNLIPTYHAVLVDEVQDFSRKKLDMLKNVFRDEQGDYVLFGDVKQNIYGEAIENKDVVTNVRGVNELKQCFRADSKILDLALAFQRTFYQDKYEQELGKEEDGTWQFMGQKQQKEGSLHYVLLKNEYDVPQLFNYICTCMGNELKDVPHSDITILGENITVLAHLEAFYRHYTQMQPCTMFETQESKHALCLKYYAKDEDKIDHSNANSAPNEIVSNNDTVAWYTLLGKNLEQHYVSQSSNEKSWVIIRKRMARLLALFSLSRLYAESFSMAFAQACQNYGITVELFNDITQSEKNIQYFNSYLEKVANLDCRNIRRNKKVHFTFRTTQIKISTIHSFKGWESEVVFLLIPPTPPNPETFHELIYTGITRCRTHLYIINQGNAEMHQKLLPLIEKIK